MKSIFLTHEDYSRKDEDCFKTTYKRKKMRKMQYDEILKRLKFLSNPRAVERMAKYGITAERVYGVSIPNLRKIPKRINMANVNLLNSFTA
ncbi:MAG: hypothetical protein QXJ93_01270 [Candidatus Rehaiarchaeum fermentans]|nr:DNA alkylation repair protein [Candidatus Rehaiarchaeum fermentans]